MNVYYVNLKNSKTAELQNRRTAELYIPGKNLQ